MAFQLGQGEGEQGDQLGGEGLGGGNAGIELQLTDPAYFAKMSALLDEIIRLRKDRAIEYEDYLARIAEVAKKVSTGKADDTGCRLGMRIGIIDCR